MDRQLRNRQAHEGREEVAQGQHALGRALDEHEHVLAFSAAIAHSARYSWTKPRMPLRNTMTTMAMLSCRSPMMPAMIAAAISTRIMESVN